jgi:hypothetical protein
MQNWAPSAWPAANNNSGAWSYCHIGYPLQNTLWQFSPSPHLRRHILFFGPDLIYYADAQYVGCYVLVKKGSEQDWKNKTITVPDKGAGQRIMLSQMKDNIWGEYILQCSVRYGMLVRVYSVLPHFYLGLVVVIKV